MSLSKHDRHSISGAILLMLALSPALAFAHEDRGWPVAGGDLHNTRNAEGERRIRPETAPNLQVKWVFTTQGDVSATPAVEHGAVYFPDWGGWLHKVDASTGARIWSRKVSDYTGRPQSIARTTPAIQGHRLILGTQDGELMAVDKRTGNLLWHFRVDPHPAAFITQSPTVLGDRIFVGVSSQEEAFAGMPGYTCCTFRGSVVAVRAEDGAVLWRTYTVPEGYSGGAVWGGVLTLDERRRSVYVTTGNNYSVPASVMACVSAASSDGAAAACVAPNNFIDSVLALNLDTGAIRWGRRLFPTDIFTITCLLDPDSCLPSASPDFDFGQGAILYSVRGPHGHRRDLVGAGQKSGMYWALDPDTGATVWSRQVGPGSFLGGLLWGSAVDDGRIYTALANGAHQPYQLPSGETSYWGSFAALDAATGQILWQTPDPTVGVADTAPVTTANGVVFGCSMDVEGHMYALDGRTGAILWDFASGGSCNAGAAVVDGTVYWGSGYTHFGPGTPNNKLYAFSVR